MSAPTKNHYERLGISYYASEADVRRGCESALRKLDQQSGGQFDGFALDAAQSDLPAPPDPPVPPDPRRAALAEERKKIMLAYAVLRDDAQRKRYNASLAEAATKAREAVAETQALAELMAKSVVVTGASTFADAPTGRPATPAVATTSKPEAIDLRESMLQRRAAGELINPMKGVLDDEREYAHLGVRFTAMMIDTAMVMLLGFVFVLLRQVFGGSRSPVLDAFSGVTSAALMLLATTYYMCCEAGKYRSTWGKRWMGLIVMRMDGDEPVGKFRAFFRYLLRQVSAYVFGLGYVMAFFSDRKQALHDRLTDSVVLSIKPPPSYWLGLGLGLCAVIALTFSVLTWKAARAVASPLKTVAAELRHDERTDANRATPMRTEVAAAHAAAMSFQRVLTDYRSTYNRWPSRAEGSDLVAKAARSSALIELDPRLFDDATFSLSLGPTQNGTARMLFIRDAFGASDWTCVPMNIDEDQLTSACGGE